MHHVWVRETTNNVLVDEKKTESEREREKSKKSILLFSSANIFEFCRIDDAARKIFRLATATTLHCKFDFR
jgi:hypothetical protein